MRGDIEVLKDWCHEAVSRCTPTISIYSDTKLLSDSSSSSFPLSSQAFNVLSTIIKQRVEPGIQVESKVLEVRDVDVSTVADMLLITFH